MSNYAGKESQYIFSHPELGSDPPIGSGRESGCDKKGSTDSKDGLYHFPKICDA